MDITSTTPATANIKSTNSLGKLAEDFDDFLKLLIAQLQNQDPTSPLDTNEFTAQIVSFTEVEQSVSTNKNLEDLIALTRSTQNSSLAGFIDKDVEVEGGLVTLDSEGNPVGFSYNLDDKVESTFVTIKNLDNETVFNGSGTTKIGRNNVTWDGIDNEGNPVASGIYQIFVTTEGENGNLTNQPTLVQGKVLGVILEDENPKLVVNGEEIPLSEVKFIGNLS